MTKVHPTAIVEKGAQLDDGVEVGAYAYVGSEVSIGSGTVVAHHATVDGYTFLGRDNQIFPYAFIGGKTHDLKYKGGRTGLKIGDRNVFREYTTAHLATADGGFTIIGNDNNILAYSHIAHDCFVGNRLVMSSHAALGGHVVVEDYAVIGWGSGVHQFCRVGAYAMLSASSKLVKDLPPFLMADGSPAAVCAINKINMQRNGFSQDEIETVFSAFKTIYKHGLSRKHAIEELKIGAKSDSRVMKRIIEFAETPSERGLL